MSEKHDKKEPEVPVAETSAEELTELQKVSLELEEAKKAKDEVVKINKRLAYALQSIMNIIKVLED